MDVGFIQRMLDETATIPAGWSACSPVNRRLTLHRPAAVTGQAVGFPTGRARCRARCNGLQVFAHARPVGDHRHAKIAQGCHRQSRLSRARRLDALAAKIPPSRDAAGWPVGICRAGAPSSISTRSRPGFNLEARDFADRVEIGGFALNRRRFSESPSLREGLGGATVIMVGRVIELPPASLPCSAR